MTFRPTAIGFPAKGESLDEVMAEILTVPTITTISYEVLANEAWREKEPGILPGAVLDSLAINDGKPRQK